MQPCKIDNRGSLFAIEESSAAAIVVKKKKKHYRFVMKRKIVLLLLLLRRKGYVFDDILRAMRVEQNGNKSFE